jgi:hypothetical protein
MTKPAAMAGEPFSRANAIVGQDDDRAGGIPQVLTAACVERARRGEIVMAGSPVPAFAPTHVLVW